MKKTIVCLGVLAVTLLFASGCSQVKNACERADECNLLTGESVEGCIDRMENCYEDFTDDEQADWDEDMKNCLDYEGCDRFTGCYLALRGFCY